MQNLEKKDYFTFDIKSFRNNLRKEISITKTKVNEDRKENDLKKSNIFSRFNKRNIDNSHLKKSSEDFNNKYNSLWSTKNLISTNMNDNKKDSFLNKYKKKESSFKERISNLYNDLNDKSNLNKNANNSFQDNNENNSFKSKINSLKENFKRELSCNKFEKKSIKNINFVDNNYKIKALETILPIYLIKDIKFNTSNLNKDEVKGFDNKYINELIDLSASIMKLAKIYKS